VEDEKDLVNMLLLLCKKRNIHVCFTARDGHEALQKFIQINPKPHLVIMNYRLPVMNGLDVSKEMLKIEPRTKIMFLTAEQKIKDEALAAGASIIMIKPVSIKEIERAIEEIVKKYPHIKVRLD
jgi:two-component system chemotaxis response regulator CheY